MPLGIVFSSKLGASVPHLYLCITNSITGADLDLFLELLLHEDVECGCCMIGIVNSMSSGDEAANDSDSDGGDTINLDDEVTNDTILLNNIISNFYHSLH